MEKLGFMGRAKKINGGFFCSLSFLCVYAIVEAVRCNLLFAYILTNILHVILFLMYPILVSHLNTIDTYNEINLILLFCK